ncbi:MAG: polyphosphate polymerase domain-containing protein [Clostridiales bacterium]|nr:polyphosphate polymerase domain-containing protein [Clostridiales bacterium]
MALDYRNELKYVVSTAQIACLRSRVRPYMELDKHVDDKGLYNIRSIYFDDYKNTCYYENEAGTSPREKFRIRIYNGNRELIHLELKRKERGKIHKDSCVLTEEQCKAILGGKVLDYEKDYPAILQKFCLRQRNYLLQPKVIVEYEREPYVYKNGNVRITFDTDIRSSNRKESFFDDKIYARPIMPIGYHLMEVKYDEYLPDHIYRSLQMENLLLSTFSKYYLCRKYNMGGMKKNEF